MHRGKPVLKFFFSFLEEVILQNDHIGKILFLHDCT